MEIENKGATLSTFPDRDDAVTEAIRMAKDDQPSQVIVSRPDGAFETEYTYGEDLDES